MKKFTKHILACSLAVMLGVGCLAGCKDQDLIVVKEDDEYIVGSEEKLIVGTNAEFPPFEYANSDGTFDGFDIALIKEIGDEIGMDVEIQNMEFKSLIGAMQTGSIDVIAAGMTVTEDREKSVDFTDSYYEAKQVIVTKKDTEISGFSDLDGKTIGVQEGTTGDLLVTPEEDGALVKDATVKRFKKGVDAIMDLKNDGVDAVVIDSNPAKEFVSENSDTLKITEDETAVENYAFAVQEGDTDLAEEINDALKELKEDGTYDELVEKYINQ